MFLDLAGKLRIDNPTQEQIADQLRTLLVDASFIVLDADAEHFIQATTAGSRFRVEWRQEAEQRFMFTDVEGALEAFEAFRRWDEPALQLLPWKRLTLFNDPYRRMIFIALAMILIALISLWSALRG